MKKTLVALAALASISAFAQSSVTLSGRVDAGYGSRADTSTAGVKTTANAIQYSGINTSFVALGGSEDLGQGLKAGFYLETKILAGANTIGDRGSYVTLQGDFGKVIAGTQNTGARDLFIAYDAGGAINVAGSLNSSTANDAGGVGSHEAFSTGVKYIAPTVSGFTFSGAVARNNTTYAGGTSVDTKTAQGYSYGANYANGPFSATISYSNAGTKAGTTSYTNDVVAKTTALGASYDLGVAKLYLAQFKLDQADSVATTSTTYNIQRKSTTLGVKAPLTAKLSAFASAGKGTLQTGATTAFTGDLTGRQIGAVYELSKRTSLKAAYGTIKAEASATTETKVKETALALVHLF